MNRSFLSSSQVSQWTQGTIYRPWSLRPPIWSTQEGALTSARNGSSYSFQLQATGGVSSYVLVSGSLPTGLSLNSSTGLISGTPSQSVADYSSTTINFSVLALNSSGEGVSRAFSINVGSKFVGITCATANEGGTASATVPAGNIINRIDFISYGTPNGSCGSFSIGSCHAGFNASSWIGQTSFSLAASNAVFGDPCGGVAKRLYVQVSYGLTV